VIKSSTFSLKVGTLFLLCCICPLYAQELSSLEKVGQHIYRTGKRLDGSQIPTFLGDSTSTIPSSLFACTNCHGPDGKGVPEGGVKPSNITWHGLTKPYGAISGTHRDRPPYNEKQIFTAIRKGTDPLGSRLENSMPRYHLTPEDGKAIIAYLKILHRVEDPGVTSRSLRLGIIYPEGSKYQAIDQALTVYFEKINQQGGIYRRQIEPVRLILKGEPKTWLQQWSHFLKQEAIFALVAPVMTGPSAKKIETLCEQHQLPVISPFVDEPSLTDIPNSLIFYFYPGISTQLNALKNFSKKKATQPEVIEKIDSVQLSRLRKSGCDALILSRAITSDLLPLLKKETWYPTLFLPEKYKTTELSTYSGEIYFSTDNQTKASSQAPESIERSTLAAAHLLRNQLLKIGRKTTRKKLINLLETLHHHPTNWTGPLTFNPNRRLGPQGAYIHQKSKPDHPPIWVNR